MTPIAAAPPVETPAPAPPDARWEEIPRHELPKWNERLLNTDASLLQYPYWNEPFRRVYMHPHYLAWRTSEIEYSYVCVQSIGPWPFRIGLVMRGPVSVRGGEPVADRAISELCRWAQSTGHFLLRFTHSDDILLDRIAAQAPSTRTETFPFLVDAYPELFVDQLPEESAMLAGFDREARRKIRRAGEAGYRIATESCPEALARVWPLFIGCSRRQGYTLSRPLDAYLDLVRLAEPHNCARIYRAELDGRPVEALLVFRDRRVAYCLLAALDIDALQGRPSPSVLLHWHAMRDMFRLGTARYNFGAGFGGVLQFKQQFSPGHQVYPAPVTIRLGRARSAFWTRAVLLALGPITAWVRAAASRLHR